MMVIVFSLLGISLALLGSKIESQLVKNYVEIKEPKCWPVYIVPLVTGALSVGIYYLEGASLETLGKILLISLLIELSCFDIKYMLLPTKLIYGGIVVAFLWRIAQTWRAQEAYFIVNGIIGAIVGYGLFWLIFYGSKVLLKKEGLGFGDVRLMGLIGFCIGIEHLFLMMIIASLIAVAIGGMLYIIRGKSEAFPFGPSLCVGAISMMLLGEQIVSLYLRGLGF